MASDFTPLPLIAEDDETSFSTDFTPLPFIAPEDEFDKAQPNSRSGLSERLDKPVPFISEPEPGDNDFVPPALHPAGGPTAGTLGKSISRGIEQSQGLYGEYIREIGKTSGFESLIEIGDELVQEAAVEAITNPAPITSLDDLRWGNAGTFVAQMIGEQIPNISMAVAALVASRGSTIGLSSRMMAAGIGKSMAEKLARKAVARRAMVGTWAGFFPLNTGEMIAEQRAEDPDAEINLLATSLLGAGSSTLEVLGFAGTMRPWFREFKPETISGAVKIVLNRLGQSSLAGVFAEGGTEAVQEAMVIASKKLQDPTFNITSAIASSEGLKRMGFAGLAGATVGGFFGGAGGTVVGTADAIRTRAFMRRVNQAHEAVKTGVDELANTYKEKQTFFDAKLAKQKFEEKIDPLVKRIFGDPDAPEGSKARRGLKQRIDDWLAAGATEGTIASHIAAARGKLTEALKDVRTEQDAVKEGRRLLTDTTTGIRFVMAQMRALMKQEIPGVSDRTNKADNDKTRVSGEKLRVLIEKHDKERSVDKRLHMLPEILELAKEQVSQGLNNPASINKGQLAKLLSRLEDTLKKAENKLNKEFDAELEYLQKARNQLQNRLNQLPEPTVTREEAQGTQEAPADPEKRSQPDSEQTAAGVEAFLSNKKPFVSIVGYKENDWGVVETELKRQLDPKVFAALQKTIDANEGIVWYDRQRGEFVIGDREAAKQANPTKLEDIDPDNAAVITERDPQGRVLRNEAVPIEEVPNRTREYQYFEGLGRFVEVRTAEEAIDEQSSKRLRELEDKSVALALKYGQGGLKTFAELLDGIWDAVKVFGDIKNIPQNTNVLKAPQYMTWGQFKEIYPDAIELADIFLSKLSAPLAQQLDYAEFFEYEDIDTNNEWLQMKQDSLSAWLESAHEMDVDVGEMFGIIDKTSREEATAFYIRSGRHLVLAELVEVEGGIKELRRTDGKPIKLTPNKGALENSEAQTRKATEFKTEQKKFPTGTTLDVVTQNVVVRDGDTMRVVKAPMVMAVFPEGLGSFRIALQVYKIIERGRNQRAKDAKARKDGKPIQTNRYITSGKNAEGNEVWFHLGSISELGRFLNPSIENSTIYGRMKNAHQNFAEGMAYLADLGYTFDLTFIDKKTKQEYTVQEETQAKYIRSDTVALAQGKRTRPVKQGPKTEKVHQKTTPEPQMTLPMAVLLQKPGVKISRGFGNKVIYGKNITFDASLNMQKEFKRLKSIYDQTVAERSAVDGKKAVAEELFRYFETQDPKKISWDDVADWLIEEGSEGRIDPNDINAVLNDQGMFSKESLKEWELNWEQVRSHTAMGFNYAEYSKRFMGTEPTLPGEGIISDELKEIKKKFEVNNPSNRSFRETVILPLLKNLWGSKKYPAKSVQHVRSMAHQFAPVDEFQLKEEMTQEDIDAMDEANSKWAIQTQPGKKVPIKGPLVTNLATTQATGRPWTAAGNALERILQRFNIKERVVIFDEDSIPQLKKEYERRFQLHSEYGDYASALAMNTYINFLESIEEHPGRDKATTLLPYLPIDINEVGDPSTIGLKEDRAIVDEMMGQKGPHYIAPLQSRFTHIFVSKEWTGKKNHTNRTVSLGHELGHIVQYTHLSRAPQHLQQKILEDMEAIDNPLIPEDFEGNRAIENFAYFVGRYAAELIQEEEKGTKEKPWKRDKGVKQTNVPKWFTQPSEADQEVTNFFKDLVRNLKKVWEMLKSVFPSYPESFQQFMKAVTAHADVEMGRQNRPFSRHVPPQSLGSKAKGNNQLARAMYAEFARLESLGDDTAYLPNTVMGDIFKLDQPVPTAEQTVRDATTPHEWPRSSFFGNYIEDWQRWGREFVDRPWHAIKQLAFPLDAVLHSMKRYDGQPSRVANEIANSMHARPGSTTKSDTIPRRVQLHRSKFERRINKILKELPNIPNMERFKRMAQTSAQHLARQPAQQRPLTQEERDYETISLALLKGTPAEQVPEARGMRKSVQDIRDLLSGRLDPSTGTRKNGAYQWYTGHGENQMGLELGWRDDHFPLMLDTEEMLVRKDEFVQIALTKGNRWTPTTAEAKWSQLTRDSNGGLASGYYEELTGSIEFEGPGLPWKKQRAGYKDTEGRPHRVGDPTPEWTEAMRQELIDKGFYQKDIHVVLLAYIDAIIRRGVWENYWGNKRDPAEGGWDIFDRYSIKVNPASPVAELQLKLVQALDSGDLHPNDYKYLVRNALPNYTGQSSMRVHPRMRKLMSMLVIFQNVRLLPFAVLSSQVDLPTLLWRMDGDFKAWEDTMQAIFDKTTREEAKQMLLIWGGMREYVTQHVLNDQALNTFMTGTLKHINDAFFRFNMMEGWTNLVRAAGAYAGSNLIKRNAQILLHDPNNQQARAVLESLGMDNQLIGEAAVWNGDPNNVSFGLKAVINRFIDEGMIRPEAAIRPAHMSDVAYSAFSHLKTFMFGFQEVFLRRAGNHMLTNVKNKDWSALWLQNGVPFLFLAMMTLPIAAGAYELRRFITSAPLGGKPGPRPDGFANYLQEVIERSGMPGVFQFILDMEQAEEYNKSWWIPLAGPTVEHIHDIITQDAHRFIPRSLPIVAQSPPMQRGMQEWIKGLGE